MLRNFLTAVVFSILFLTSNVFAEPESVLNVDFKNGMPENFEASHGWTNGEPFNVNWHKDNITFQKGKMQLLITKDPEQKNHIPYNAGEFRSVNYFGYGRFEVRMKAAKTLGVVSNFFTYTGPHEGNPQDQICISITGKNPTQATLSHFKNGRLSDEVYNLGFDASKDFHTYAFEWYEDKIVWFVDGKEVRTDTKEIPTTKGKVFAQIWTGKESTEGWMGKFGGRTATAEYEWIKITQF